MSNAGYANLLAHLHNPSTPLPLPTIQSALAHHLSALSPLPTPLAASAVSAPLFAAHPVSHPRLQALFTAFRHATHLKFRAATDAEKNQSALGTVFSRGRAARLRQWAGAVLKGLKGGQPILRLACAGGLLAGLDDLKNAEHLDVGRAQLEDEIVIAVAESIDVYSASSAGGWEAEFQPKGEVDTMTLALILATQSLTLVVPRKLTALPLALLTALLTATLTSAFAAGRFLSPPPPASSSASASPTGAPALHAIAASPLMQHIAPLSKLTALSITILCESRPAEGMRAAAAALGALHPLAARLEGDWVQGGGARGRTGAGADTQEDGETALVWTTLKTLLFATLMVADAALSGVVFVPPAVYASPSSSFSSSSSRSYSHPHSDPRAVPAPAALATTLLHTLAHLAFVVSQFGGVTTAAEPGFVELKKTFYLALDVLAGEKTAQADGERERENESERFVREVCADVHKWRQASGDADGDGDLHAKTAYALTCIEQLVPVLGGACIQAYALPLAIPYLSDAANRETYESSHSVVLAVFASHAEQQRARAAGAGPDAHGHAPGERSRFTERMVPFYARCLIENAADGMLSTAQLRLAFAALVRSASASAGSSSGSAGEKNGKSSADGMLGTALVAFTALVRSASADAGASAHSPNSGSAGAGDLADRDTDGEQYALAWYCVDALLGAIHTLAEAGEDAERLHRLHLALISAVPSLPLALLPRVLEEIRAAVLTSARAKDLVDATFVEIAERVGDREKELAMRWWYDNRSLFQGARAGDRDEDAGLRIDDAQEQQQQARL